MNIQVTLWPAFPHFRRFSTDNRIQGIRLNSAMMSAAEIDGEFEFKCKHATVPLWFDIKGMQLRIKEVICDHTHKNLEFILNRPIKTKTPCPIYFKAGEDAGKCIEIKNGTHFIFEGGPRYEVRAGESIHLRQTHEVGGPTFLDYEIEKIKKIVNLGFEHYYLSYVYDQSHVNDFRELIGKDALLYLKIENKKGLEWIQNWKPEKNTFLAAARGDLYVELDYPHEIMNAVASIIAADPEAIVGSRMLLSLIPPNPKTLEFLQFSRIDGYEDLAEKFKKAIKPPSVPSCADFSDLAWLYDVGYRSFLLCDELCLHENLLSCAVNVLDAFRKNYAH